MRTMRRIASATVAAAGALILFAGTAQAEQISSEGGSSSGPVTIPSNYVYNPDLGALHDYCTFSQDQPEVKGGLGHDTVDFRGPCARHDLCYAGSASKKFCDDGFLRLMRQQCQWTFDPAGREFDACMGIADRYHWAVVQFGDAS